jgi:hypothetical protein
MEKKTLFIIQPHSMVDVITNSSSELFVFEGKEKETIIEMIKSVYPDYLEEYSELKNISELTSNELDMYFSYMCSPHIWPARKSQYPILPGFTFDELYEPEKDWKTGDIKQSAWNGEIQYRLKNNEKFYFVTDENREECINKLSPNRDMYFLFSYDDNPNYEYQELLEMFGQRIHLG